MDRFLVHRMAHILTHRMARFLGRRKDRVQEVQKVRYLALRTDPKAVHDGLPTPSHLVPANHQKVGIPTPVAQPAGR